MYQPAYHRVDDLATQHAFMRAHPLGFLVTGSVTGVTANPLPFQLDAQAGSRGVLRGHVARANPQWRDAGGEALVVFLDQGAYVTPGWYASKKTNPEVVPTWNYVCVQARGQLRAIEDRAWLRRLVEDLTDTYEAGQANSWAVSDAPADYIDRRLAAVVGLELTIEAIEGKWKVSQNQSPANRAGVAAGLRAQGDETSRRMADYVEQGTTGRADAD